MKIGVTGGIGSGKSLVVETLQSLGAVVYSADVRAKEIVYRPHIQNRIIEVFGRNAFQNKVYNTKYIGSIVFSNAYLLSQINAIIHPEVFRDFEAFSNNHKDDVIVYESALMIETSHTYLFDKVILVTAPIETRIERVMTRDHLDKMTVWNRMKNQWSDEKKSPFADFIIQNIDKNETIDQITSLWKNHFQ